MIRLFSPVLAFAALLSANAVAAPAKHRPAPHRAAVPTLPADADPALWVAKDADTTIYLFGTIHVLKPGLTWFDEAVRKAFDSSSELRLEMVLPDQATAQATALRLGTTTSGPTLPERLPPAVRAKYLTTVTGLGLPATALDRFQPWFAANNLTVLPLLKLGYALDSGAERVLTEQAKAEGKTISGFETLDQQLGFFTSLSEKTQVTFLKGVLDELPKVGATTDAMVADWARGDPNALAKLLNDDLSDDRELAKTLLQDRNARWADWIAARMGQPGTVFIAVGAGHLAGPDSVQAKLAARGVKVERVRYWSRWLAALLALAALAGCARQAEPVAKPALWRATDGDTVIWLFGTIHLLPPDVRWQNGPVAKAIAQSDTLITEIPDEDAQAQAAVFLKLARADGLPPLSERVPPAERAALTRAVAASGVPAAALDRMTSWGAALALASGAARELGAIRADAPEAELATAFAGRRHDALETVAGQLGLFAALPEDQQRQLLRAAIRAGADPAADYRRLLDAWTNGDPAAIERAYNEAFADAPALRTALVEQRNRAWADDLTRRAARPGTLFVAVGAGHMVGPAGLPALLSARGFRVARVQ